jgi:putative ubiquitin-RnfH superfamily antitoxin RatB of RatAB toxin-antitoxin module
VEIVTRRQRCNGVTPSTSLTGRRSAAIDQCGVLRDCPRSIARERIGVHGRLVALADVLREGDRVEILRPLVADPKPGRRRRAQSARRRP